MGIVYAAVDARLKRQVAIKILREAHESTDRRRRFLQEAQAASSLNHPNIVTVHDVDTTNGVDFIVMEYLDGSSLHRLIEPGGIPLESPARLRASDGGCRAQRRTQPESSIAISKPSNVMVARDGRLKILDFGLSKLSRPEPCGLARTSPAAPSRRRPSAAW